MDDRDRTPFEGQSYSFEPVGPEEPPRRRKSHTGLVLVLLALLLAGTGALALACGHALSFDRFDGGFTIQLSGDSMGSETPPAAPPAPAAEPQAAPAALELPAKSAPKVDGARLGLQSLSVREKGAELSLQEIYRKLIPSFASITTTVGSGSGIVLTADGYIATNAHVVNGARAIQVTLQDGFPHAAQLIGADAISDLAVLKIEITELTPVDFGDSEALEVGDAVVAIGDPLGRELRGTMTDGIVSAINRDLQVDGRTMTLIQTNAALNEGNSGGPLINTQGQVIGINTMKMSSSYASIEGLGFAIPSTTALPILQELMEQGYISGRPALGFDGITVPAYASAFYRLPQGVYIRSVEAGSAAETVGLRPGDVITAWGESAILDLEDLTEQKNACSAGDVAALTVYRQGSYYRVDLELAEATN